MGPETIIQDIKEVKIQGANHIALAGISAYIENPTKDFANHLSNARPTEPLLQNSLKIIQKSRDQKRKAKQLTAYIENSEEVIAKTGFGLIRDGMNIFTHCHSTTVVKLLIHAKQKGKNFVVYNTEARPLLQGRKTAEDLAAAGIKVIHLPDTAAELALKKCDLFLFGADAYLPRGVVNKVGTSMLCELARAHGIPAYSCGVSLKYVRKIKLEMRSGRELWDERNKLIDTQNPAFDFTKKKFVSGVVSELGIHQYKKFAKLAKKNLKNFLK